MHVGVCISVWHLTIRKWDVLIVLKVTLIVRKEFPPSAFLYRNLSPYVRTKDYSRFENKHLLNVNPKQKHTVQGDRLI